ncbi:MAG: VOC family protein [Bdellovibrionota bacterium]
MEPRLTLLTLGVTDLARTRAFYEKAFGWKAAKASQGDVVFFKTHGTVIALYPRHLLAEDAKVPAHGSGFSGVTCAFNVPTKEDVAKVLATAEAAGAVIKKPAQDVFWGGHSGYFADPEGHLWEVAWNPFSPLDEDGFMQMD